MVWETPGSLMSATRQPEPLPLKILPVILRQTGGTWSQANGAQGTAETEGRSCF